MGYIHIILMFVPALNVHNFFTLNILHLKSWVRLWTFHLKSLAHCWNMSKIAKRVPQHLSVTAMLKTLAQIKCDNYYLWNVICNWKHQLLWDVTLVNKIKKWSCVCAWLCSDKSSVPLRKTCFDVIHLEGDTHLRVQTQCGQPLTDACRCDDKS